MFSIKSHSTNALFAISAVIAFSLSAVALAERPGSFVASAVRSSSNENLRATSNVENSVSNSSNENPRAVSNYDRKRRRRTRRRRRNITVVPSTPAVIGEAIPPIITKTVLDVQTGGSHPLYLGASWGKTATIQSPQPIYFRWATTATKATGARWQLHRGNQSRSISGPAVTTISNNSYKFFLIDLSQYLAADSPMDRTVWVRITPVDSNGKQVGARSNWVNIVDLTPHVDLGVIGISFESDPPPLEAGYMVFTIKNFDSKYYSRERNYRIRYRRSQPTEAELIRDGVVPKGLKPGETWNAKIDTNLWEYADFSIQLLSPADNNASNDYLAE